MTLDERRWFELLVKEYEAASEKRREQIEQGEDDEAEIHRTTAILFLITAELRTIHGTDFERVFEEINPRIMKAQEVIVEAARRRHELIKAVFKAFLEERRKERN